jgi:hypothetical protein
MPQRKSPRRRNKAAYTAQARRQLAMIQKTANFFHSEYRKYRAHNSEVAQYFRDLTKLALRRVGFLKRYIKRLEAIQRRLSEVKTKLKRK